MSIVIKSLAGPFLTKVTYPDLNYQGKTLMTPDQMEACAERAYEILAANSGERTTWAASRNKGMWLDAVRDHHLHPDAIVRKGGGNQMEWCIQQAYEEMQSETTAEAAPLVVPPSTKKGIKSK